MMRMVEEERESGLDAGCKCTREFVFHDPQKR